MLYIQHKFELTVAFLVGVTIEKGAFDRYLFSSNQALFTCAN